MRKAIAVYATATKKRERKENRKKGEKATKLETKISIPSDDSTRSVDETL
jgi:hypothetical protein